MDIDPAIATPVSRRSALVAGAVGAGVFSLAACSPGGNPGSSAPSAAAGTKLVALDSITVGQAVAATLPDGSHVLVARPTETSAACFSAVCTHMGCQVAPAGTQLHCPCHGSIYNATTGAVIQGPAPSPLAKVTVHVANGEVVTGPAT